MFGTYQRLRVHVWASDVAVIRAARRKLTKDAQRDTRARVARKAFYRTMLDYHHNEQTLCVRFKL